ncbi:MAG: alkyl sulfatase dimerization domain-containing protein [Anaerolineae bacterium]|jgi:alkyl sulfatase BDS1-like metallo-beta-lactamase superfamily hydrolase
MESQAYEQFRDGVGLGSASAFWPGEAQPFGDRALLVTGHGNVGYVYDDAGVVMIDTGTPQVFGDFAVRELRRFTGAPIRTVIYTHGHIDHAFNLAPVLADAEARGYDRPQVIAHRRVPARFARYERLRDHTTFINRINFGTPPDTLILPEFYYPDTLVDDGMAFRAGDYTVELHAGIGETDDALWAWIPERRLLFPGDFLLWSFPNIGNPFKVQRYAEGWALALEEMAALQPAAAAPGHGPAVVGEDQVRDMLLNTAQVLRYLHDEVVRRLNAGQTFEQILREVDLPDDLKALPYLAPIYGSPTYTVHAILREYAGWYDYNPSHLHPSPTHAIAAEVAALAGGAGTLLARAREIAGENPQLALHLVDFALASGDDDIHGAAVALKADLLEARAQEMDSFISYNILNVGAQLLREDQL